jgi:hypothetical protein
VHTIHPDYDPAGTELRQFLSRVQVGPARTAGPITIVPLCPPGGGRADILTLGQALANGGLRVSEIGEGRVNELYVDNQSKSYVYIMAGQILVGAKQNRILQHDLLLPPLSGQVAVEAYCVQHGRWEAQNGSYNFKSSNNVSNPSVRHAATVARDQGQVWGAVSATQRANKAEDSTGDLNSVYESRQVRAALHDYREEFANLPDSVKGMQGAVLMVRGRVVAADVFGNSHIFRRMWSSLLDSYLLEANGDGGRMPYVKGGGQSAENLLAGARQSPTRVLPTPGTGILMALVGMTRGEALVWDGNVLHVQLFPAAGAVEDRDPMIRRPDDEGPIQRNYQR